MTVGAILIFLCGFAYGSISHYVDNINDCNTYKQSSTTWVGYRAISADNQRRCFWVEDRFPNRVRHGVEIQSR
jgi:hypothetical protein